MAIKIVSGEDVSALDKSRSPSSETLPKHEVLSNYILSAFHRVASRPVFFAAGVITGFALNRPKFLYQIEDDGLTALGLFAKGF